MKIVQINTTCGIGSTGRICEDISRMLTERNVENHILFSCRTNGYPAGIPCSTEPYVKLQALKSRILGNYGFNSRNATREMLEHLERLQPDLVHIHNIHGHDCHLEMLFSYFRKHKTKLVWTFHDCWAFTGYCPHFAMIQCGKWKSRCSDCPQKREYSWFSDRSGTQFDQKQKALSGLDLTIVTPSRWLADLVGQSFLREYPVQVIPSGIDLSVFQPTPSDFRQKNGLEGKKLILGVAFEWGPRKGLDVFADLAGRLSEDYRIVLAGTDSSVDRLLPSNILSIHRTRNLRQLAEIYTAADVFVNPTREENYPTVNMEALASGTPVLTFRTGGSPEIPDETCGSVVDCDDTDALEKEILRICEQHPYSGEACLRRAEAFDKNTRFQQYWKLYDVRQKQ